MNLNLMKMAFLLPKIITTINLLALLLLFLKITGILIMQSIKILWIIKMTKLCKNCKLYIPNKTINNCKANMVGTIRENDSACYKIQFNEIKNINDEYEE